VTTPLLATKLFIPPTRPGIVRRPDLIARLSDGLHRKLTLIAAPAGFGKTTLASEWVGIMRKGAQKESQLVNCDWIIFWGQINLPNGCPASAGVSLLKQMIGFLTSRYFSRVSAYEK
jgi:hypothetical protein